MKSVLSVLSKYPVFASALVLGLSSGLAGFALAESETPVNPKPDTPKTEIQAKVQKEAPPVSIFDKLVAEYEEKQNAPPVKKQETPVKKSGGSIIDRAQAELAEETSRTGKKDTGAAAVKDSPSKDSAKDTEKSPVKIADNSAEKAAEKKIDSLIPVDSFWSVVKPNEAPVEKIAEKQSSENKPETKSEQTAAPAVPKETEQKEVVQEVPVNASVWDAVPTSISLDGTTFAGAKSDIKSDVKTAEETITEPVKIAVRIEAVNSAQKESVADSEKPAEKPAEEEAKDTAEKPAEEMAKDETVAETEEAVKEPAEESAKEMAKEETAIETKESVKGPVAEEAAEVAKEESKPAEQKSGEAKEDETKEKAKKDAKDRVKTESEKSETASVEEKKETAPKKSDAGKSDTEKSEKEVSKDDSKTEKDKAESKTNDKKSHAFSGSIPKTADMLKDLTDKNLAEKQELDGIAETSVNKEPQRLPELTNPDFDDDIDDTTVRHSLIDGSKVGDPHAKDKIKLMYDEIINGLKSRNMHGKYEMWKNYARSTLRSTTGLNTGSEVDGRCRLSWYTQLYSEPIFSVFAAEEFSRQLHHGLSGNHRQLAEVMSMIRKKLDVPGRNDTGIRFPKCETPFDAINEVKRCLLEAQMAHARAMSTISANDQKTLATDLYSTFSGPGVVNGHTIPNRTYGRKLVNILETMDKSAMHAAADALMPLTNKALLALLDELPEDAFPTVHINGQQVQRIVTSAGDIIIGGRGNNVYDLDSPDMKNVVCVIDLGGNDLYRDGTCNLDRPILVIIDLHGNDIYTGTKPGIQGGSILGVSLLIDCEGNDTYTAGDVAQGSSIGGIGILLDYAGDDSYKALKRAQGHALCGVGVLCDYAGNDKYRASLWAQGFGAPGGFGVLNDVSGKDHYFCGGIYYDSYPEHPGYDGWGQGVGAGIRQVANGGIGVILDGGGDDVYEVDYFGHGGGYWLGVGIARDFGGNDIRHGTTKTMYDGSPRREAEWTRFANGFGCHYACGYLFDDEGDDVYGGKIMGTGMAWDLAIGYLCDFNGNDRFTATGGMTQGIGAEGSIGILFCYGGDDVFLGRNQAFANSNISYHSPSNCGSNFSFLINYGGNDQYGSGAKNNSYVQRGSAGGFLIDRPTEAEEKSELAKLTVLREERQKEIADWDSEQERLKEEAAKNNRRYVQRSRRPQPIAVDIDKRVSPVPSFVTVQVVDTKDENVETKTGDAGNKVK